MWYNIKWYNSNELKSLSQNVISENKEEIYTTENPVLTKYLSLPEKGFVLSADNKKYDLYGLDYDKFVDLYFKHLQEYKKLSKDLKKNQQHWIETCNKLVK